MKHVVIVANAGFVDGGADKVAIDSAIALSRRGVDVCFFCAVGPVCPELSVSEVDVVCLGTLPYLERKHRVKSALKGLYDRNVAAVFDRVVSRLPSEYTVIHIHSWLHALSSSVFAVARRRKIKVFLTAHEYSSICPNMALFDYRSCQICEREPLSFECLRRNCDKRSMPQKLYRFVRTIILRSLMQGNRICYVYISQFSRRIIEEARASRFLETSTFFLSDPISMTRHPRRQCHIAAPYLFVGRLSPEKGAELFCKAVSHAGFNGVVVGDGEQREHLEKAYPSIDFVGWKNADEVGNLMSSARALVFPSLWYETAGLVVLEAQMGFCLPCIVPDRCAASDYVKDGETGMLFQSGSMESLETCLLAMKSDEIRDKYATAIERMDFSEFSLEGHCDRLVELYEI